MKRHLTIITTLVMLAVGYSVPHSNAQVIASFDLNGITGGQYDTGTQYQSGLFIKYNASLAGWSSSGFHSIHAVQETMDNWALMVYSGGNPTDANVYTLNTGIGANTLGVTYYVSYDIAPSVYTTSGQATQAADKLRINVLNPNGVAVATNDVAPGAWAGTETFHKAYFSYLGDGTGNVRLQITTANTSSTNFAGAVDNIAFEASTPQVPEPSAWTMLGVGATGLGLVVHQRRRPRAA